MPLTECNAIRQGLLGNTLDFLSKNVVLTSTNPETGIPTSAERSFDFSDDGPTKQGGKFYACIVRQNPRLINGLLTVSYLPWGENTGYYIILEPDSGPDIMMTATMDGCSVGYVRANDGAVRVSHHNVQSLDMDHEQKKTLAFATSTLHPSGYRYNNTDDQGEVYFKEQGLGFVFGVRCDRKWKMYAQKAAVATKMSQITGKIIANDVSITEAAIF